MLEKRNDSRRRQVVNLQKAGLSYAEIGRRLGITRQRVRQIVVGESTNKKKQDRSNPDTLLSTGEVAELLNMNVCTIRRWSNNGVLKAYRVGPRGDRRIRLGDIDDLLLQKTLVGTG